MLPHDCGLCMTPLYHSHNLDLEAAGDGIRIGQSIFDAGAGSRGNNVTLLGCHFYGNKALSGGGLSSGVSFSN